MIGFVISGEGARGAWQAEIMRRLMVERGVMPDYMVGISSGAINAAAFSRMAPQAVVDMWSNITGVKSIMQFQWDFWRRQGLFSLEPLIHKMNLRFGQLGKTYEIAYVDAKGKLEWLLDADAEHVAGAVAIPGVMEPVRGMTDAGPRVLAPLDRAISVGCDEIYAILGKPEKYQAMKPWRRFDAARLALQGLEDMMHTIMENDLQKCQVKNCKRGYTRIDLHIIRPNEWLGSTFDFASCADMVDAAREFEF